MEEYFRGSGGWGARRLCIVLVLVALGSTGNPANAQIFRHHAKNEAPREPGTTSKQEPRASKPAAFSIPVEPLGFFAPGAIYQGQRESLVSLDFLDEDHLLFSFHAPGLIRREGNPSAGNERQIRALALALPSGSVTAEALWTLHDRGRYLWMLNDGHFFLRDQNDLKIGDASLELKPDLHFAGPLLWVELDPTQQLMVTESQEPAWAERKQGDVSSSPTASAQITTDQEDSPEKPDVVLRILRRPTGQVMLTSRTRKTVHLAFNSEGWIETLRGNGHEWVLSMNRFRGGSQVIGRLDSMCAPSVEFMSNAEVLATACNPDNSRWMIALSTKGRRLWNLSRPATQIWPRLIMAPDGLRFARETLVVTHEVGTLSPLSFDDVKEQRVEVYDAATGKVELTAPASPILDGGGNVAISPSGHRVAILDADAIQVYELSAPEQGPPGQH